MIQAKPFLRARSLLAVSARYLLGLAALGVKVDDAKVANLVGTKAPKAK
jgi:hypothetical protein